ncbi:hypothetical protein D3C72_892380 [compost metagenome]
MYDGVVADGAHFADDSGKAGITVHHHAFLNIGAAPDADRLVIAAQRCAEPDADILAERDRAMTLASGATQ